MLLAGCINLHVWWLNHPHPLWACCDEGKCPHPILSLASQALQAKKRSVYRWFFLLPLDAIVSCYILYTWPDLTYFHVALTFIRRLTAIFFCQVKKAFRKKSFQCHPDLCPPAQRPAAEKAFKEVAEAYAILSGRKFALVHLSV